MRVWLKESTARSMSEVEAAWLAGFFDGEGSLSHYKGGKGGKYLSWRICIANTHLPSLERCQLLTGVGSILPKPRPQTSWKPQWQWSVTRQRDIEAIMRQLLPYLVTKQEVAQSFLNKWRDVA